MPSREILRRKRGTIRALALLASAALPACALAQTDNWSIAVSGNWNTPGNWSAGVPNTGDQVSITGTNAPSFSVTYNYNGTAVALNSLTVALAGGTAAATLSISANTLSGTTESVGVSGNGIISQIGGTNQLSGNLNLNGSGGGTGAYTLSGTGTLSAASEYVGESGLGVFSQTGGTNTFSTLAEGDSSSANGQFNLSAGSLTGLNEDIGELGPGSFNQSGGTNSCTSGMYIGYFSGSTGAYTLSGSGALSSPYEFVGDMAVGGINQSGGINNQGTAGQLYLGYTFGSTGGYSLSGTGTLMTSFEAVGYGSQASFNQSGGSNNLGTAGSLYVGYNSTSTGSYSLSGTGTLSAGSETIGNSGNGSFNQTAGTNTLNGTGSLSLGTNVRSTGMYTLSGGSLAVGGSAYIGGTSTTAGGVGVLTVGTAGTLRVNGTVQVWGHGTMNVEYGSSATIGNLSIASGGVVNLNGPLFIDYGKSTDPISTIVSYLTSGFAGGAWNGTDISSSAVANLQFSQNSLAYSVGYVDGADHIVSGISSGEIEIMPTLAGDATLSGTVDFFDFQMVLSNFGKSNESWDEGNFMYSSTVGFADFQAVLENFGATDSALTASELAELNSFSLAQSGEMISPNANGVGYSLVAVPEPMAMGVVALAGLGMLKRRRARLAR